MGAVQGTVAPGLEAVRDAFAALGEPAAAVAAVHDGRPVVDLFTGERDALVHVFSVSKPLAALGALVLVDRGVLELDALVADLWPAYAAQGKGATTVRHVLAHQAGLVAFHAPQPLEALLDAQRCSALLAAEAPWWTPGTRHGEHALLYGNLVGELVRRADGRTLGAFLREEVCGPWGLDAHVGLGPEEARRVADVQDPGGRFRAGLLEGAGDLLRLALDNPPALLHADVVNGAAWRAAEVPAVNVHATARAFARLYGGLLAGGELDGVRLLRAATLDEALRPQAVGPDVLLGRDVAWGLGPQVEGAQFGMGGIGGSLAYADRERGLAFAYVTCAMGGHERAEAVERALLQAL